MADPNNPLYQLLAQGQSVWLDSIERNQIQSGALKQLIETMALRGETSNPSIFEKAIASREYDKEIKALGKQRLDALLIYERLATDDVRAACDVFRPVYDETKGGDGFVSIEVSPRLAYDPSATYTEVQRLWKTVDRPNLMVKIPGTPEGIGPIEGALHKGININITLLFSVAVYEEVAWTYVRALERRVADGLPIDGIASVASFFVSRIDTLADQQMSAALPTADAQQQQELQGLMGKVAIANAQIAYEKFMEIFSSERWLALQAKGGRVQRPLWASTSTKNPAYRDVVYVEQLIGPHTVNTMPLETMHAFAEHGVVARTVDADFAAAHDVIRRFEQAGFSLDAVTAQVLTEGVGKFELAFDGLLDEIRKKD